MWYCMECMGASDRHRCFNISIACIAHIQSFHPVPGLQSWDSANAFHKYTKQQEIMLAAQLPAPIHPSDSYCPLIPHA